MSGDMRLLESTSVEACQIARILDENLVVGLAALRCSTPAARRLLQRWLTPSVRIGEYTRQLDPRLAATIRRLRERNVEPEKTE
jgi:hypothetical protein